MSGEVSPEEAAELLLHGEGDDLLDLDRQAEILVFLAVNLGATWAKNPGKCSDAANEGDEDGAVVDDGDP